MQLRFWKICKILNNYINFTGHLFDYLTVHLNSTDRTSIVTPNMDINLRYNDRFRVRGRRVSCAKYSAHQFCRNFE